VAVQNTNNSKNIRWGSPACGRTPCIVPMVSAFFCHFLRNLLEKIASKRGGLPFEWLCKIQTIPKIFPRCPLHMSVAPASSLLFPHFLPFFKKYFKRSQAEGAAFCVAVQNTNNFKNIPQASPACGCTPCSVPFFSAFFHHLKRIFQTKSPAEMGCYETSKNK